METGKQKEKRSLRFLRASSAGVLILLLGFYSSIPSVHSSVNGWVMLYTQKSAQSITGAILRAGHLAPLKAVLLAAFQTAVLPWLLPYGAAANAACFGPARGCLISLAGALAGASVWYGLIRLLLGGISQNRWTALPRRDFWFGYCLFAASNWLTLGMLAVPAALAGALRISCRRFVLFALLAELPILTLYTFFGTEYRVLLPNPVEAVFRILGVAMALVALAIGVFAWKKHQAARQNEKVSKVSEP
ncbi:MAG: hypothetical protein ABFC31_09400 [Clostridiaceae bacterium]